jgi:hypothetical protein
MRRPDPFHSIFRAWRAALVAVAALALAACGDSTGNDDGEVVETSELQFLSPAPDAPPLVVTTASFYAKKGEDRRLRMFYRPRPAETDSTEFLRFEVKAQSLLRRPNGSSIAQGDSVLITVTVVDLSRFIVDFQPSGLRFDPDEPAELKLEFDEADDDIDDDGDIDGDDDLREAELSLWRRETATQPWVQLASQVEVELEQLEADILGFTNYAIAYRRPQ